MKDVRPKEKKSVGYGFVGVWQDGKLGWYMPRHLAGHSRKNCEPPADGETQKGTTAYLCKITVELVKAKNGRLITRRVK